MLWMYKCIFFAFLGLSGLDFSAIAQNLDSRRGGVDRYNTEPRISEGSGAGGGNLRFSDDEDFGDGESGSGSGSGYGNPDIIIDSDEVTTARKPPLPPSSATTTTTSRPLSDCQTRLQASKRVYGLGTPRCLPNGDFDALQCEGNPGTGECWCSDLDGREIPGTNQEAPNFPDCDEGSNLSPCVFHLVKHTRGHLLGQFRPRCQVDGQYKKDQCQGNLCFCVDESTGRRKAGTEVNIPEIPDCDDDDDFTKYKEDPIDQTPRPPVKPDRVDEEEKIDIDDPESEVKWKPDGGLDVKGDTDSMDLDDTIGGGRHGDNEDDKSVEITNETGDKAGQDVAKKRKVEEASEILTQPGLLAGIIGGSVVLFICLVLLVMFIIYRMRKKDEGSYPLDEPSRKPNYSYVRAPEREFYA